MKKDSSQSPHSMMPMRPGGPQHSAMFTGAAQTKDLPGTLNRLGGYLHRQKARLTAIFLLVLVSSASMLAGPYLIGKAIDSMVQGRGAVQFPKLLQSCLALMGIYGVGAAATWLQIHLMIEVAQSTVRELRREMFAKLQTLPIRFFDRRSHGELMSRLTNDIDNVNSTLTQSVTQIFSSLITLTGSLLVMLWLSPALTGICLITIPLGLIATRKITTITRKSFGDQQQELGSLNGLIEEMISGHREVTAFGRQAQAQKEFSVINQRLTKAGIRSQIYSGLLGPLMNTVNNLSFITVAATGGWMAVHHWISVGMIASFINYSKQFGRPISEIAAQYNMIQSALAGAERVFEILDEPAEIETAGAISAAAPVTDGQVIFKQVGFGYQPHTPVLNNIDLFAQPGQSIALVGPTGAGKTTIVNLLTRFYEIDRGEIWIDGQEIRSLNKAALRRCLGIVLQDCTLFSGSVRENIRYGRLNASDAEVEQAAVLANAHLFIERLPQGYDTMLSEDGGNLSQGQRQLLTIARTILADPAILILDEATSNVDTRTELHIQQAMLELMKGRTSFVIAHRLSTIRNADQILVLNGGTIVERGTHHQLLSQQGFYHHLYTSQFQGQAT